MIAGLFDLKARFVIRIRFHV